MQNTKGLTPMAKDTKIGKNMHIKRGEEKKAHEKAGGSNVGKYKDVKKKDFAGTSGGAPKGSFPINTLKRAKAALSYAHNAPDPAGIRAAVKRKYGDKIKSLKKEKDKD